MYTRTFTTDAYPGATVTYRPLTGPIVWDLIQSSKERGRLKPGGEEVYKAFRFAVTDWVEVPMLDGRVSAKFDPLVIDQISPNFVGAVVDAAFAAAFLSEEERKNS